MLIFVTDNINRYLIKLKMVASAVERVIEAERDEKVLAALQTAVNDVKKKVKSVNEKGSTQKPIRMDKPRNQWYKDQIPIKKPTVKELSAKDKKSITYIFIFLVLCSIHIHL